MTTYTWSGPAGADWNLAADWSPAGGPPGFSDVAVIQSGGTVNVGEAESVDGLSLAAGSQLFLSAATFAVAGFIDNTGLILAGGTVLVAGSAVTLSGAGTLALTGLNDGSDIAALTAGEALVNAGGAIAGTGTIGGDGLVLTNAAGGVIDAASLEATAATLSLLAMTNAGLLEATTAALVLSGDIANSGTIAAVGGTVTLLAAAISGGTLAGSGGGVIVSNAGTLDGSGAPLINTGPLDAGVGGVWTSVLGTIENQGSIGGFGTGTGAGGGYVYGADLALSGTVVLTGDGTAIITAIEPSSTAVLVNAGNTISGPTYGSSLPTSLFPVYVPITNEAAGVIDYAGFGNKPVSNDGTIANSTFAGVVDQTGGGTITSFPAVAAGTTVEGASLIGDGSTVEGGTLAGLVTMTGSATLDGSVSPINNTSIATLGTQDGVIGTGAVVSVLGSIDNTSEILVASAPVDDPQPGFTGRIVIASPTVSLTGGGQVQLSLGGHPDGPPANFFSISAAATGDVLVNVDNTITGNNGIGSGGLVLDNQSAGIIDATGNSITLDPLGLANAGTLEATTGQLVIDTPSLFNTGVMEANGSTLTVATGTITDLTGSWIAVNSTIALPAPGGIAGIAGDLVLEGPAADFVSSVGTNIPSLTNSYLAPETILASGVLAVFSGSTFGIARTPSNTVDVGGNTIVTGNSLQPFGNAGLLELAAGAANLTADVTNTGVMRGYGTLAVSGAVMNNAGGTVEAQGGVLIFQGALTGGQLQVDASATLELSSGWFGGGGAIPVSFDTGNDLMQIDATDTAGIFSSVGSVTVSNFVYGDTIAVDGSVAGGGSFPGFTSITNDGTTLTFIEGSQTLGTLGFAGGTSHLVLSQDANHDELVTVACFAAGTNILTHAGEIPVEALRIGDTLPTLRDGHSGTVRWLGHRQIDCRRHPRPHEVLPIRVRAGAFAPDMPRRDLILSPDHAVYVEKILIPVRYLVNGASIAQIEVSSVTYWHVELDRHDVILAEGLPAETYLDTDNRFAFANARAAA